MTVFEYVLADFFRTFIFESAGGSSKRKARDPGEIIVFAVDCSHSMHQPSDFLEMQEADFDTDEDENSTSDDDTDDDVHSNLGSPLDHNSLSFAQLKGSCS